ncbi:MAG: hypothetical protein ABJD24_05505 [Acidimicrobiales bacterium]
MGLLPVHASGQATSAMAENQRAASAIGLSPDWIADANWALGSALAGVATILIGGVYAAVLGATILLTLWGVRDAAGQYRNHRLGG